MPMRPGLLLGLLVALLVPGAAVTPRTFALVQTTRTQTEYELQHCTLEYIVSSEAALRDALAPNPDYGTTMSQGTLCVTLSASVTLRERAPLVVNSSRPDSWSKVALMGAHEHVALRTAYDDTQLPPSSAAAPPMLLLAGQELILMNLTLRCEAQKSSTLSRARGGAVEVAPGAFLSTRDTRFEGCTAREGGAVHGARGARLLFDSSTFADNVAERGGARGRKRSPIPSPPPRAYAAPERARGGGGRRARACASAAVTSTLPLFTVFILVVFAVFRIHSTGRRGR